MPSTKRKSEKLPSLEEMLNKIIFCYYCDKEAAHLQALQSHMKAKHIFCVVCNKRMDTKNGVQVHMNSVHKMPFERVEGAIEGRGAPDGPEIYLMTGVPDELMEQRRQVVIEEYSKMEYEHRVRTGNSLSGDGDQPKKPKIEDIETPEERAARRKAWIAQKRAEKAAKQAAAEKEGAVAVPSEQSDSFTTQEPYVKLEQTQTPETALAQPANNYYPGYATSPPSVGGPPVTQPPSMGGLPIAQPLQQAYGYGTGPQFGYSSANYGQPSPFSPHYPTTNFPHQPAGYGGLPQGFPPQPPASYSPISHASSISKTEPGAGINGKGIMPPAPGLPQRPSFDAPSFSKEDMIKFHYGQNVQPTGTLASYGPPAAASVVNAAAPLQANGSPQAAEHVNTAADRGANVDTTAIKSSSGGAEPAITTDTTNITAESINDAIDELIAEGMRDAEAANQAATTHVARTKPKEKKSEAVGGAVLEADDSTRYVVSDNIIPEEEKRAKLTKYANASRNQVGTAGTVVAQEETQAVTGPVADELEQ